MAQMGELNEACVLDNLKQRYHSNLIYTFSGLFLVAINPYRNVPIYEDETVRWYRGQKKQDRPPHIFSVADGAYQALMTSRRSQSILITGESGAGKTENTKKVIHYLTSISSSSTSKSSTTIAQESSLEKQLILTNPILESFGNAQTVRNNNSSRFGKFIRIDFDPNGGHIIGARIEKYLLEKSRVTHRSCHERNFHVFYQLLGGASDELLIELKLMKSQGQEKEKRPTTKDFAYTSQSNAHIAGTDDSIDFQCLQDALSVVGIDETAAKEIYRILAVILLLGNLKITQEEDGQAQIPESEDTLLQDICTLLGIEVGAFKTGLLNPVIRAGKEIVTQAREMEQVQRSIEALSRSLYERLFSSLVDQLNSLLFSNQQQQQLNTASTSNSFIGVLDIAGFEIFEKNSFEQLLINYTNEKLQQFFNHHMFVVEQEEYARQGIKWDFVDFGLDSQPMIDLLERANPVGILPCLDEDCVLPKANDKSFTSKVQQLCLSQNSSKFEIDRLKADQGFILNHYAGRVEYSTDGWLEKNKDPLNENITRLIAETSSHLQLKSLFSEYSVEMLEKKKINTRAGIFRTVAQKHRESLNQLMNQLASTQPHFVRCIVPNNQKQPGVFIDRMVLEQLQCNGVLEGIRICKQGYPNRLSYADFWRLYSLLNSSKSPSVIKAGSTAHGITNFLLDLMGWREGDDYALGQEKVFFRAGRLGKLDSLRDAKLAESLRQLQAICRGALVRAERDRQSTQAESIKLLQAAIRPYLSIRRNVWSRLIGRVRPLLSVTRSENRIRELQAQMSLIQAEKDTQTAQLRTALNEERDTLSTLQIQLSEEERLKRVLQVSLQERQDALLQATTRIETLQGELEHSKTQKSSLERQNKSHGNTIQDMESRISELKDENDEIQEKINCLQQSLCDSEAQKDKLSSALKEHEAEFERRIQELQAEKEKLQIELQESHVKYAQLSESLEDSANKLDQAVREHRLQIRNLQGAEEKKRNELAEEVENQKRRLNREMDVLRSELDTEKKSVGSLKEAIRNYESGSTQAEAEKSRSQQAFKREKERLEGKAKELSRLHEEAIEREDSLQSELMRSIDAQRQLKTQIQELEDSQVNSQHQNRNNEAKLNSLQEQLKDSTTERAQLRQKLNESESAREEIQGQFEEVQDSILTLQEQLKCAETVRSVLDEELRAVKISCTRLTGERDALQAELATRRGSRDTSETTTFSDINEIIHRLENGSLERQGLLRENRRLERELQDALDALSERDILLSQTRETVSKAELKARKLQTALEESEAIIIEGERVRRRLSSELLEEKERGDRQQRECERIRLQHRQQSQIESIVESSMGNRTFSCASVTSRMTDMTIDNNINN